MLIKLRDGIKGLIFFITPMPDDTFLKTLVMWESHERNSFSSTPRHLLQLTFFNDMPFIERSRLSVTVAILCLKPTRSPQGLYNGAVCDVTNPNLSRFSRLHFRLFQVHPKFLGYSTYVTRSVTMRHNILTSA